MLDRNLPCGDSFWTRWFFQSATRMSPALSSVMPQGWLNSPSPFPGPPHLPTNLPSGVKTCRRLLPLSTTMTLPLFSTARPAGRTPFADELAVAIEYGDGVGPFIRYVDLALAVDGNAKRPNAVPIAFAVFT